MNTREWPRVLIADDDPHFRSLLQWVIELEGLEIEVLSAQNGDEAWRLALETSPSLVILDLRMPGRSAFELITAARSHPELKRTHFCISSASHDDLPPEYASTVELLPKPYSITDLKRLFTAEGLA